MVRSSTKDAATLRRTTTPEEARREAARLLGSIRTERKAAASRANGFKPGHAFGAGRKPVPLLEIPCTCAAGEALEGHHWKCPRGQAVKRRIAAGRDPMTGAEVRAA